MGHGIPHPGSCASRHSPVFVVAGVLILIEVEANSLKTPARSDPTPLFLRFLLISNAVCLDFGSCSPVLSITLTLSFTQSLRLVPFFPASPLRSFEHSSLRQPAFLTFQLFPFFSEAKLCSARCSVESTSTTHFTRNSYRRNSQKTPQALPQKHIQDEVCCCNSRHGRCGQRLLLPPTHALPTRQRH